MSVVIKKLRKQGVIYVLLFVLALIYIAPFLIMFTTSFKTTAETFSEEVTLLPQRLYWGNYRDVFEVIPFFKYFGNTLFVTGMNVLGTVLVTPMIAFSLSKLKWKGRDVVFNLVMATLLLPYTATMIPIYKVWTQLGLVGTYYPLIVQSFLGYPYYIVILKQFMVSLPDSLLEAATIDGCNTFQKYYRIVLPLSKSGILSIAIFSFLFTFSDFLGPMLYINEKSKFTLSLGLQAFMNEHTVNWNGLMAASSLFVIPVLLLFFLAQRYFVEGISTTGLK